MARAPHDVAIVGIHATPITKVRSFPIRQAFANAAIATLEDAGIEPGQVDGLVLAPPGLSPDITLMFGASLAKYLGIEGRALQVIENGGVTSALALRAAANEVALGRVECCLVLAADERTQHIDPTDMSYTLRTGAAANISLQGLYDGIYAGGFPVPFYAMAAQRYAHEYGVGARDFAMLVVQLRRHAARHPGAQFREETTVAGVLASPVQSPPLTLHMCCPVSTGAAGVLLTTVDAARNMGRGPIVRIAGIGGYHEPEHFLPVALHRSATTSRSVVEAAQQAYAEAGVGPNDIDVAEVYGVFAPSELMLCEDLGFVPDKGEAPRALADGKLTHGGDVVVNPTGGRICYGHPAAATPLLETVEIVHQLRGRADGRQVEGARWGLTHAEHGCMNGSVVMIYEGA